MDSFLFAVNAVSPIVMMMALGYLLKKLGLLNGDFAKLANRLVFRVFLPAMLFLNVYKIEDLSEIEFGYVAYVVVVVVIIFLVSLPLVCSVTRKSERRGVLLQATFRSNYALIGIPLAQSLFGNEGVLVATLLSAVIIPIYTILAVISLSVFSNGKVNLKKIATDIIKNPFIISIFAGLAALALRAFLTELDIAFRLSDIPAIYTTLMQLSNIATPMALLVLGAQFELSTISELRREILFGTAMRTLFVPFVALFAALILPFHFSGAHFAVFVAVFATPVAVSSVPMAQEMGSDSALAGQLVVFTTIASALTVFVSSFALKAIGIF